MPACGEHGTPDAPGRGCPASRWRTRETWRADSPKGVTAAPGRRTEATTAESDPFPSRSSGASAGPGTPGTAEPSSPCSPASCPAPPSRPPASTATTGRRRVPHGPDRLAALRAAPGRLRREHEDTVTPPLSLHTAVPRRALTASLLRLARLAAGSGGAARPAEEWARTGESGPGCARTGAVPGAGAPGTAAGKAGVRRPTAPSPGGVRSAPPADRTGRGRGAAGPGPTRRGGRAAPWWPAPAACARRSRRSARPA